MGSEGLEVFEWETLTLGRVFVQVRHVVLFLKMSPTSHLVHSPHDFSCNLPPCNPFERPLCLPSLRSTRLSRHGWRVCRWRRNFE